MVLSVRVDDEIKEQSEELFGDLGLNMTTAINVFLRACIREKGIPFPIVNKSWGEEKAEPEYKGYDDFFSKEDLEKLMEKFEDEE